MSVKSVIAAIKNGLERVEVENPSPAYLAGRTVRFIGTSLSAVVECIGHVARATLFGLEAGFAKVEGLIRDVNINDTYVMKMCQKKYSLSYFVGSLLIGPFDGSVKKVREEFDFFKHTLKTA